MYRERMEGAFDRPVVVTDTITRLEPELRGAVIVSASHGGRSSALFAMAVPLTGVVFNDAGIGCGGAGVAGLPMLQGAGVPAAVLGHESAEIGNGLDGWSCGLISGANAAAQMLGVRGGCPRGKPRRCWPSGRSWPERAFPLRHWQDGRCRSADVP